MVWSKLTIFEFHHYSGDDEGGPPPSSRDSVSSVSSDTEADRGMGIGPILVLVLLVAVAAILRWMATRHENGSSEPEPVEMTEYDP